MRIALIQNHPLFGKKEENIQKLIGMIESVEADLYVLPELCYTGYQFTAADEVRDLSDTVDSPIIGRFAEIAHKKDAAIVFGYIERETDRCYNASVMVTPEGLRNRYRKTHLFYKEKLFFASGDTGFNVFSFKGVNIGLAICFDWYFPESFRTLALQGADIIAHSSNLVMPYCQQADFARALENRIYVATANRIGTESRDNESLTFTGESVLVSPKGEYLLRAAKDREEALVSRIDLTLCRSKQLNPYNDIFADRRPETYRL